MTAPVATAAEQGMLDCLQHTYHRGGMSGLFRGAGARVLHYVPATSKLSVNQTNGISDHNGKATNGAQPPNEMIKSAIRTRKSKKED